MPRRAGRCRPAAAALLTVVALLTGIATVPAAAAPAALGPLPYRPGIVIAPY